MLEARITQPRAPKHAVLLLRSKPELWRARWRNCLYSACLPHHFFLPLKSELVSLPEVASPPIFLTIWMLFSGQNRAAGRVRCARASVGEDDRKESQTFPPPGELQYFGKLSASCVAGALVVKYGSICVPSVTSPNLNVALVMIAAPCLLSVALLTLASIFRSDGNARKQ